MEPAPVAVISALTAWVLKDWTGSTPAAAPTTCSCLCQVPEPAVASGWSGFSLALVGFFCCLVGLTVGLGTAIFFRLGWSEPGTPLSNPGKGKKGLGVLGKTLELKYYGHGAWRNRTGELWRKA